MIGTLVRRGLAAVLALAIALALGYGAFRLWDRAQGGTAEIRIDPANRYQTIRAWEATSDLGFGDPDWAMGFPAYQDLLAGEIGINRLRIEIRAGAETHGDAPQRFFSGQIDYAGYKQQYYTPENDNDDPMVIDPAGFNFTELDWHVEQSVLPMRQRLEARGEKLLVNLCYVSFTDGQSLHQDPQEYAELVLATFMHLREKYGFVPDYWEVILEPDLMQDSWTGEEIGAAIVAAADRLRRNGMEVKFIAPSVTDMNNAARLIDGMLAVPGVLPHLAELSYHRYTGRARKTLPGIAARARRNGIDTSMLELWFGRATDAVLFEDLKKGQVSAWQGREAAGWYDVDNSGAVPRFTLRPDTRLNRQVTNHVRPGAVRIGAGTDKTWSTDVIAFERPQDGGIVAIGRSDRPIRFAFVNLPAGQYEVSWATAGAAGTNGTLAAPVTVGADGRLEADLPNAGLLTVKALPAS